VLKKIQVVFLAMAFFTAVAMCFVPLSAVAQQDAVFPKATLEIETRSGARHKFQVEMAETDPLRQRGLMFRNEMAPDAGMLFTYKRDRVISMWMANTYLSLDMLFIESNGRISRIVENTIPLSRETISSRKRARGILELNAGTARRLGLSVGDIVLHERFE
jgi:uncharacterized membrane protein (UPF0127 family)